MNPIDDFPYLFVYANIAGGTRIWDENKYTPQENGTNAMARLVIKPASREHCPLFFSLFFFFTFLFII